MIKNSPYHTGDVGLIPAWGTKIPYAIEQLGLCAAATGSPALWSPRAATKAPTSHLKQQLNQKTKPSSQEALVFGGLSSQIFRYKNLTHQKRFFAVCVWSLKSGSD